MAFSLQKETSRDRQHPREDQFEDRRSYKQGSFHQEDRSLEKRVVFGKELRGKEAAVKMNIYVT